MSEKQLGFKRLHFFKMFLTDEDWNDRHRFHVLKQQNHTLGGHGQGIVPYFMDELIVRQMNRPEMSVTVGPGLAVDKNGDDIGVAEVVTVRIPREDFYLPCTVYIVARFEAAPVDLVRLKDGTRKNRYFKESSHVELVARPPQDDEVELARIQLSVDVYKITDARNPENPKDNEIDLRYRRYSTAHRTIDRELKRQLLDALAQRRWHFIRIAGHRLLRPAAVIAHSIGVIESIVRADLLSTSAALQVLEAITMLDGVLAGMIKEHIDDPWVMERPDWKGFMHNIDLVHSLLTGPRHYRLRNLEQIISFLNKGLAFLPGMTQLYGNESLVYHEGQPPVLAREYPLGEDWERIKVWSAEFPETIVIDGMEWGLIGTLNITDEADEKKYKFRIDKALDAWRTRQRNTFPDGSMVDDTGVAHEGGYAEYELRGVIPDTHLAVIRMMDYARADFELEFVVNDQVVGVSQCVGYDRQNRWRNWPFVIPAWFVNDDTVRIKQHMKTAARDVNMFRFWFYQPIGF